MGPYCAWDILKLVVPIHDLPRNKSYNNNRPVGAIIILLGFHSVYLGFGPCCEANILHSSEAGGSSMQQDQGPSVCTTFLFCPALNIALTHLVREVEASSTQTALCCSHFLSDRVMLPVLHSASWDGTGHKESNDVVFPGVLMLWECHLSNDIDASCADFGHPMDCLFPWSTNAVWAEGRTGYSWAWWVLCR